MESAEKLRLRLQELGEQRLTPLDMLPEGNLPERVISLLIDGIPDNIPPAIAAQLSDIIRQVNELEARDLNHSADLKKSFPGVTPLSV